MPEGRAASGGLHHPRAPVVRRRACRRADPRASVRPARACRGPHPAPEQSRGAVGHRSLRSGQRQRAAAAAADPGRRSGARRARSAARSTRSTMARRSRRRSTRSSACWRLPRSSAAMGNGARGVAPGRRSCPDPRCAAGRGGRSAQAGRGGRVTRANWRRTGRYRSNGCAQSSRCGRDGLPNLARSTSPIAAIVCSHGWPSAGRPSRRGFHGCRRNHDRRARGRGAAASCRAHA